MKIRRKKKLKGSTAAKEEFIRRERFIKEETAYEYYALGFPLNQDEPLTRYSKANS